MVTIARSVRLRMFGRATVAICMAIRLGCRTKPAKVRPKYHLPQGVASASRPIRGGEHDLSGRIPWTEVSRIDEHEMRELMQEIVNRLYTFHLEADDPKLQATIERWMGAASKWDEPEIDPRMIGRRDQ